MKINERAQKLVEHFKQFNDWEDAYREIINIGKNSSGLADEEKVEKYLVKGCQSQVWLIPIYKEGVVNFKTDSYAFIVKGIAQVLEDVFSGHQPSEILKFDRDFLKEMGIKDHLSLNRTNGLAQMNKQIKMYAVAYEGLFQKGILNL